MGVTFSAPLLSLVSSVLEPDGVYEKFTNFQFPDYAETKEEIVLDPQIYEFMLYYDSNYEEYLQRNK